MATKSVKLPKKPKASASVQVLENYVKKCSEIQKKANALKAEKTKKANLRKKIAGIKLVK